MQPSPASPPDLIVEETQCAGLFRAAAKAALLPEPLPAGLALGGPSDFDLNPGTSPPKPQTLKAAAVLIPIVARDELSVILTERTVDLPAHAGQVAFPGGKIDDGETTLAAALREAEEEIGLDPGFTEPLGYLEPYRTGTGFLITPVVGLVRPDCRLAANPREVASIFEVPLSFLLDTANHRIDKLFWRGAERRYYAMPYGERYIWGATAGIIKALARRLADA